MSRIGHRYGEGREARAHRLGAAVLLGMGCAAASASPSHAFFISPLVDCVTYDEQNNTLTAKFGYVNSSTIEEDLTIGSSNFFFPFPSSRGQPTVFLKGVHHEAFDVTWNLSTSPEMTWHLLGDKVTASLASPRCAGDVPPPVRAFSLKCYDAKGARIGEAVKLDDRFDQAPRDATVAGPAQLCNAVEVTRRGGAVVENPDPSVSFTCYELAQGATRLPGVRESNLFGRDQALQVGRPRTLCVPNDKPAG